jgi:hypothetical protein
LSLRSDTGDIFENWFVMERIKRAGNNRRFVGFYFWRTYDQKEIGLVEDIDGTLTGFECKWSPKARVKAPKDWIEAYPGAGFEVVTQANWKIWLEA